MLINVIIFTEGHQYNIIIIKITTKGKSLKKNTPILITTVYLYIYIYIYIYIYSIYNINYKL